MTLLGIYLPRAETRQEFLNVCRLLPSHLLLRHSHPHAFLDEEPIIYVLFEWLERIDQAPVEPPEHFKEHFVELDPRNVLAHTPKPTKPEYQVKSLLHPC